VYCFNACFGGFMGFSNSEGILTLPRIKKGYKRTF
jgi:hypothetical protein